MYPALNQSHRRITVRLRSPNAEFLGHHPNKGVSDEAFSDIAERFSSYQVSSNRIELMLPIEHPDLDSFIKHARALNLNIEPNRAVPSQVEILDYTKFSHSEIAAADFLEGAMSDPVFDNCVEIKSGDAIASVEAVGKASGQEFGSLTNLPGIVFVRGSVKSKIESSSLRGLHLSIVRTDREDAGWPDGVDPLYRLWSSMELPNSDLSVFNNEGEVRASSECDWSDEAAKWYPLDRYEVQPRLSYNTSLPETDVALSREHFGGEGELYRRIIYSQKAKSVLEDLGMKLDWVPVEVKDESHT